MTHLCGGDAIGPGRVEKQIRDASAYTLAMLLVVSTLNAVDRQIVNVLAESIKRDLALTDTQIGLMSGTAFALFYAAMALPLARLAERVHRPVLIAGCMAFWSLFTVACGAAQSFAQLFAARVLVGVGEAGSGPASHALVADLVSPERRARALAFVGAGGPLGALFGLAWGGIVADALNWRWAFGLGGAIGIVLAIVVALTLGESRRSGHMSDTPSFAVAISILRGKVSFWMFALASSLLSFAALAFGGFFGSLLARGHAAELSAAASALSDAVGLQVGQFGLIGFALALCFGAAGAVGVVLGGVLTDRIRVRDPRAYMSVPAVAALVSWPCFAESALAPTCGSALLLLAAAVVTSSCAMAPVLAGAQSIAPPAIRATTSALLFLIVNLFALGLGPLAVGALSDVLGEDGLRRALAASAGACALAAATFWQGRHALLRDLEP